MARRDSRRKPQPTLTRSAVPTPGGRSSGRNAAGDRELVTLQRRILLRWFRAGGRRAFPWRRKVGSYQYFVAEMLLQRTRAESVVPVFDRLIRQAPNLSSLARLPRRTLARGLFELGLPKRADRLRESARLLMKHHGGRVPRSAAQLRQLPGVGPYTSDAIAVFAWNQPIALLDWTTQRVVTRLVGHPASARPVADLASRRVVKLLRGRSDPRIFNWALIDLAATYCQPRPKCLECPLLDVCRTGRDLTRKRE